jgi:hypothetical protein
MYTDCFPAFDSHATPMQMIDTKLKIQVTEVPQACSEDDDVLCVEASRKPSFYNHYPGCCQLRVQEHMTMTHD